MIIYRAECEDGGGPFYKLDGTPRDLNMPYQQPSNCIYGADSLDHLKTLIADYGFNISDFIIKTYDTEKIHSYNHKNGHIIFSK